LLKRPAAAFFSNPARARSVGFVGPDADRQRACHARGIHGDEGAFIPTTGAQDHVGVGRKAEVHALIDEGGGDPRLPVVTSGGSRNDGLSMALTSSITLAR
jgi:hypothetical protein